MYVAQSVIHSFITMILVEISFYAWGINDHLSKFRFRVLTLTLPVFMFPLFQFISPERGSWHFRLNTALFDSQRWIDIKIMGVYPVALLFLLLLFIISVVFFVQEIFPIIRNRGGQETFRQIDSYENKIHHIADPIFESLKTGKPEVVIIDEAAPILFTKGFKNHTVFISQQLIDILDEDELQGALTHEAVHMMRGSSMKTQGMYLSRMLMFYNPVSLVEFRRIVHEDEFICDAITIAKTGNPEALIRAISAFCHKPEGQSDSLSQMKERIEVHSHNLLLEERMSRLREIQDSGESRFNWFQFGLTAAATLLMGYLVV